MCRKSWCFLGSLPSFGRFVSVEFLEYGSATRGELFQKKTWNIAQIKFHLIQFLSEAVSSGCTLLPSWYCMLLLLLVTATTVPITTCLRQRLRLRPTTTSTNRHRFGNRYHPPILPQRVVWRFNAGVRTGGRREHCPIDTYHIISYIYALSGTVYSYTHIDLIF